MRAASCQRHWQPAGRTRLASSGFGQARSHLETAAASSAQPGRAPPGGTCNSVAQHARCVEDRRLPDFQKLEWRRRRSLGVSCDDLEFELAIEAGAAGDGARLVERGRRRRRAASSRAGSSQSLLGLAGRGVHKPLRRRRRRLHWRRTCSALARGGAAAECAFADHLLGADNRLCIALNGLARNRKRARNSAAPSRFRLHLLFGRALCRQQVSAFRNAPEAAIFPARNKETEDAPTLGVRAGAFFECARQSIGPTGCAAHHTAAPNCMAALAELSLAKPIRRHWNPINHFESTGANRCRSAQIRWPPEYARPATGNARRRPDKDLGSARPRAANAPPAYQADRSPARTVEATLRRAHRWIRACRIGGKLKLGPRASRRDHLLAGLAHFVRPGCTFSSWRPPRWHVAQFGPTGAANPIRLLAGSHSKAGGSLIMHHPP